MECMVALIISNICCFSLFLYNVWKGHMAKGNLMAGLIWDLCESICVRGSFSLCHWAILHGSPSLDFVWCHELESPETWFWDGDWCTGSLSGNALVVITCGKEGHEAALGKGETGLWWSLTKSLANPQGTLKPGWPFRVVLNWDKGARPL